MLLTALGGGRGVLAIAGAGGKTTLLFRLADEARAAGLRVLVTTTTHMGVPRDRGRVLYEGAGRDVDHEMRAALEGDGRVVLLGRRVREDKVAGVAPDRIDRLQGIADVILVEADGARGRSFKVPADHEPVVPASARMLVVVAGLDVLGATLDEANVHRWERVAAAAGQPVGSTVTEDTLVRGLSHPAGYLARVPPGARAAVFLNKADHAGVLAAADRITRRLSPPYDLALAGSARDGSVRSA